MTSACGTGRCGLTLHFHHCVWKEVRLRRLWVFGRRCGVEARSEPGHLHVGVFVAVQFRGVEFVGLRSGLPCLVLQFSPVFAFEKKLNDCCCPPGANLCVLWICRFSSTVWEERRWVPSKFHGRTGFVDAVTFLSVLPVAAASKLLDAGTMKTSFRIYGSKFYRHFQLSDQAATIGTSSWR